MRPGFRKTLKIIAAVSALLIVLVLSFAYLQYRELKKTLLVKISDRATSFIGQRVEIKDMSFSPLLGIILQDITVKNPEGFHPGELLKIERLYLSLRYRELVNRRLHFEKIGVNKPQLTVLQDKSGRINISDALMDFFKRKPTFRYRIDEFSIQSGTVDFSKMQVEAPERIFRSEIVNLRLKGLSSDPGVRTSIDGEAAYEGNILKVQGWAYIKDEPKRLNISISSEDLTLVPLKEMLSRYGIDADKTKITFAMNAEGDTDKGFDLESEVRIKKAEFAFLKRGATDIRLEAQAFLNIRENTLLLKNVSLDAGGVTAARLTGEIKKSKKDIYYAAGAKIEKLDLSALNFVKGMKVGGIMTSDNLRVRGSLKEHSPKISGIVRLRDGFLRSDSTDIGGVRGDLTFLPADEISFKSEAHARMSKVYGYTLYKPADTILKLSASGNLGRMHMISSVNLARVEVPVNGKSVYIGSVTFDIEGAFEDRTFGGEFRIGADNIQYDNYQSPWMRANSHISYKGDTVSLKNPAIEGKDFKITSENIAIGSLKKEVNKVTAEVKALTISYPARKAEIRNADLSLNIFTAKSPAAGDFSFSAGGMKFSGFNTGFIKGSGAFDHRIFSLEIPNAEVTGGSLKLEMKGKTSEGPFPIVISAKAGNIDLERLSEEAFRNAGLTYGISGNLKSAVIKGTMQSPESVQGDATIRAEKLSIISNTKKNIIRDVSLKSDIAFKGKDLNFKADVDAGKVSANVSGVIKEFAQRDRLAEVNVSYPEVKVMDIRETLWEVFPEGLLYAGLDGSVSSDLSVRYGDSTLIVNGELNLYDIILTGENGEYSVGPIRGVVPLAYSKNVHKQKTFKLPSYERSEFDNLLKYYSQKKMDESYNRLSLGSVSYGFRFLEDVNLWIRQEEQFLDIGWFSGRVFGGRLNGSAIVEFADGIQYRAGFILEGLSLKKLCDSIEPIRGYIRGNVDGTATMKGTGTGIAGLIGKAEFWTYSTTHEKTKISKEFLHKVGGPSLKKYLGDRNFDKGVMNLYLQKGFVVFRELEIANTNFFGVKDLDIKVAPFNNRIAIDHLMWSITEAAYRAMQKEQP